MFWTNQKKQIEGLEQRLKRQEQALKLKNEYISIQEAYISKVIDQSKLIQNHLFDNRNSLDTYFTDSFVFSQAREVLNGVFYWCKKINDQLLIVMIDCGEGDAAGVVVQTHIYHLLEQYSSLPFHDFLQKIKVLIEVFRLELSLVSINNQQVDVWGNGTIIIVQDEILFVQAVDELQHFTEVNNVYFFSKGMIEQPNHGDNSIIYSQERLFQFIQKNIHLPALEQFTSWENELDEWMGCCAEQKRNMLFLGMKL